MLKKLQADKDKIHDLSLKEALSITKYGSRFNIDHKLWQFIFSNFTYYHPNTPQSFYIFIHKQERTLLPCFLIKIEEKSSEGRVRDAPAENSVIISKNNITFHRWSECPPPLRPKRKECSYFQTWCWWSSSPRIQRVLDWPKNCLLQVTHSRNLTALQEIKDQTTRSDMFRSHPKTQSSSETTINWIWSTSMASLTTSSTPSIIGHWTFPSPYSMSNSASKVQSISCRGTHVSADHTQHASL